MKMNETKAHYTANDHTWALCAYGESPYLEDCIRSLEAQRVRSRIILSTATPSLYIEEIAARHGVPVYTHEGSGIGRDWNAAYDLAETRLVTIAHQDDLYEHTINQYSSHFHYFSHSL